MRSTQTYKKMVNSQNKLKMDSDCLEYDNFHTRGIRNLALAVLSRALVDAKDIVHANICKDARKWILDYDSIALWCSILSIDPDTFVTSVRKCIKRHDQRMDAFTYFFPYSWLLLKKIYLIRIKSNWKIKLKWKSMQGVKAGRL